MTQYQIALNLPLRKLFTYQSDDPLKPGQRVTAPFRGRQLSGIVIAKHTPEESTSYAIKPLERISDSQPAVLPSMLSLLSWLSRYYHQPLGEVLQMALPPAPKANEDITASRVTQWLSITDNGRHALQAGELDRAKKQKEALLLLLEEDQQVSHFRQSYSSAIRKTLIDKQWVQINEQKVTAHGPCERAHSITLTDEQAQAVNSISSTRFTCTLLEGITGSGKTEVYCRLISEQLAKGKQALILTPEIALAEHMYQRLTQRFDADIALLHSGMSHAQRRDTWSKVYHQLCPIIIGTRSALFAPANKLGLIILDEEHDSSYQQTDGLRFHARNAAIYYARQEQIPIVLGSATPSLESLTNAKQGDYQHLKLTRKAMTRQSSEVRLIDINQTRCFHGLTADAILSAKQALQRDEQVLFFINRRGYAPLLFCESCQYSCECQHCDAKLTFHQKQNALICHHCGSIEAVPQACPKCQHSPLSHVGQGTEQIEAALNSALPDWPLYRIDRDTIQRNEQLQEAFSQLNDNRAAIMLGTEMLTKGHHFPALTLVVVINADGALFSTDFRSTEHLAQQLIQVSGRAGRESAGEVIIQTAMPEHPIFAAILQQDYSGYAQILLASRASAQLPPFQFMAVIRAEDKSEEKARHFCETIKSALDVQALVSVHILGPAPALMKRKNQFFRYQLLFMSQERKALHRNLSLAVQYAEHYAGQVARWHIEVDPASIL